MQTWSWVLLWQGWRLSLTLCYPTSISRRSVSQVTSSLLIYSSVHGLDLFSGIPEKVCPLLVYLLDVSRSRSAAWFASLREERSCDGRHCLYHSLSGWVVPVDGCRSLGLAHWTSLALVASGIFFLFVPRGPSPIAFSLPPPHLPFFVCVSPPAITWKHSTLSNLLWGGFPVFPPWEGGGGFHFPQNFYFLRCRLRPWGSSTSALTTFVLKIIFYPRLTKQSLCSEKSWTFRPYILT